jgi:hypothetical protein
MDNGNYLELATKARHLQAENDSLKQLLKEQQQIAGMQQMKQTELQLQISAGAEMGSSLDNKGIEILSLKNYITDLKDKAEAAVHREQDVEKELSRTVSTAFELENIKSKYNYLQARLDDLTERLQQMNWQQTQQQHNAGRIAELESLLAIAEEEIELLKLKAVV